MWNVCQTLMMTENEIFNHYSLTKTKTNEKV